LRHWRALSPQLREGQLHLPVVAIRDPESGHLRRFDGCLEREAQRIGHLDAVLADGGAQGVDDPLDGGLVLGVQLGDEVFCSDHWGSLRLSR